MQTVWVLGCMWHTLGIAMSMGTCSPDTKQGSCLNGALFIICLLCTMWLIMLSASIVSCMWCSWMSQPRMILLTMPRWWILSSIYSSQSTLSEVLQACTRVCAIRWLQMGEWHPCSMSVLVSSKVVPSALCYTICMFSHLVQH